MVLVTDSSHSQTLGTVHVLHGGVAESGNETIATDGLSTLSASSTGSPAYCGLT